MDTLSAVHINEEEAGTRLLPDTVKPQVLLVDDDETLISSLRRRLQEHFDIHLATSGRDALAAMQKQGPMAVVVADMSMPGMDGATLLGEVKRFFPSTVRLMLTGCGASDVVNRAVNECEVFRFLSKPCRPADLDRALEEAVRLHEAWGGRGAGGTALPVLAPPIHRETQPTRFDVLTGLPSRHAFELDVLSALAERSAPNPEPVLLHLDIDHFRLVNEARGLGAGDALLRHVARSIREVFDSEVSVARLWADEFGVLLRGASGRDPAQACKRLLEALSDSPFHWDGKLLPVSVSAGAVRLSRAIDGVTSWLLLAESACGVAKQLGPGRLYVGDAEDPQISRRQQEHEWLARMQRALEENRFQLMFQRIVPLQGPESALPHFELLLRMQHESGSLLSPAFFMPIAERYHLAGVLDRWVIGNAFQWLAHKKRQQNIALCSVNLSGTSLCDPQFLAYLLEMQEHWRIAPEKICLEITETAAVNDIATAARVIRSLRGMGFRFALDDFGSGLCSFGYLKHLDVDFLKIDGSFVKQLDSDRMSRAMVQSINDIGQITGKKTVAEFVENEVTANILRRMNVDFAQGYGIHVPAPLETFS